MGQENLNKTRVRLEIDKTIQPEQFEPIKIISDVEESFYWGNEEDRSKKMDEYRDRLLKDFVKTFDEACVTIGEPERCIGRVLTSGDVPVPNKDDARNSDDEWDNF